jgi:alkylation response protein AidB-like acyl-CoA dehydrogenase
MALTEDQTLIVETARSFAKEKLAPYARAWEEAGTLDRPTLEELGSLGFGGIYCKEDVGGSGLTRLDSALIFEQLSRGCVSTATFVSIHNMSTWMIDNFGGEALRKRLVPSLAAMTSVASYCLTEPGAGSDAASLRSSARRDGDSYILNGSKSFISGATFSDIYVVMARTADTGASGISCFAIEKSAPGLSFGKLEHKMGWRAQPTAQVIMDDCVVPAANRLGEEGQGFRIAMSGLDGGRLNISACSLGGATEAFERALAYSRDRKQFGQAIFDFQATQFKLADMAIELEASRVFLREAAARLDAKAPDATKFCAMAKRFVTDTCFKVANDALQIHGGYGYLSEFEIERIVRDLRVHQILEGTNEIMRVIVARELARS